MTTWPRPHEVVPHAPPALLLSEVVASNQDGTTCRAWLSPTGHYARQGIVPAVVAVELMAQTMGVHRGLACRRTGEPFGGAFLVGLPQVELLVDTLPTDAPVDVSARVRDEAAALTVCDAEVRVAGQVVARGRLQVFHGRPEEA